MSTRARIEALASALADGVSYTVYAAPGAPGRGDVYAYVEPPSYVYEPAVLTYCVSGRPARLDVSVVVIGSGTAPGQSLALLDAVDAMLSAIEGTGYSPSGDATPGEYQGTPAYVIPLRSN